jgi:lipoprotein-releasing system permease protein
MKLSFLIALRYLFSKKSTNAINIISMVSMGGMGIGAFALIVVLSVYNGFEDLVLNLQNSFYPDIEIRVAEGKLFEADEATLNILNKTSEIENYSFVLEENAYLRYNEKSVIATTKGVDGNFFQINNIDKYVPLGKSVLKENDIHYMLLGAGIDFQLNTNVKNPINSISVSIPKKTKSSALMAAQLFNTGKAMPGGIFAIQNEFDSKYVFISLDLMQEIMQANNKISGIEIKAAKRTNLYKLKENLSSNLSDSFKVVTRYEQDEELYQIMKIEKYATIAVLGLILFIISFNIVGSLSMLAMEKKKDISILKSMGADKNTIKQVFLLNGTLGSIIGSFIGLAAGLLLVLAQKTFGFVKLGGNGGFVIDTYPVIILWTDILIAVVMVTGISLVAAWYPAKKAAEQSITFD